MWTDEIVLKYLNGLSNHSHTFLYVKIAFSILVCKVHCSILLKYKIMHDKAMQLRRVELTQHGLEYMDSGSK